MENVVLSATGIKPRTRRISIGTPPPQAPQRKQSLQQIDENEAPSFQRPRRRAALNITDTGGEEETSSFVRPRRRTLLNVSESGGDEESVTFVHPRRRAVSNISERSGNEGGEMSRAEMYEKLMSNDVFEDETQDPQSQQDFQQLLADDNNQQQQPPSATLQQQQNNNKNNKNSGSNNNKNNNNNNLHHLHNIQEGTLYHAYVVFITEHTTLVEILMLLPLFLMAMYIVFVEEGKLYYPLKDKSNV